MTQRVVVHRNKAQKTVDTSYKAEAVNFDCDSQRSGMRFSFKYLETMDPMATRWTYSLI